jgi:hypothetical protein
MKKVPLLAVGPSPFVSTNIQSLLPIDFHGIFISIEGRK